MEEKTASGAMHGPGCFFCTTALPLIERYMSVDRCFSEATRDHFKASRVEFLKGIRSLIDDKIAHLSKDESKGTHVTVE